MKYEDWLSALDLLFDRAFGLTHRDFEDWNWFNAWNDGYSTFEAFKSWALEQGYQRVSNI